MSQNAEERDLDAQENEELEAESSEDNGTDSTDEEDAQEEQGSEEVSDDESESDDGDESEGDSQELRDRLNRAHSQIERLKQENTRLKSGSQSRPKGSRAQQESSLEATEQALLAAYGHKNRDDQETIKELARKGGMSVAEALNDDFIMSRFDHMKEKARVQRASARPSGKATSSKRGPGYYIERGEMPKDPEAARAVRAELARRSSQGYLRP